MKNVTISLEEDVAHWARVLAARRNTSVSRLLGDLLKQMMEQEEGYEKARADYMSQQPTVIRRSDESLPKRDELHERHILR